MWMTKAIMTILDQVYVQFILQLVIAESIFLYKKPKKNNRKLIYIFSFLLLIAAGAVWTQFVACWTDTQSVLYAVIYPGFAGLTYLWILFIYEMTPDEVLFSVAGGYAVEHMAFTLTKFLLYCVGQFVELDIDAFYYILVTRFLVYFAVAYLVYVVLVKKNDNKLEFRKGDLRIVELAMVLMVSAILLSQYYNQERYSGTVLTSVICPLYGFICCVLVLTLVYYVLWTKKMQWEQDMMEQLVRISENQQRSSKEAIDIINIKCHDLKHQINALAKLDNAVERQMYIEEIRNAVSIYDSVYHTGNEALDYVLREKTLISAEYGIKFSSIVDGSLLNFMSAADIYALMSNAIDNAFECVLKEREEKRIVSLQIKSRGRMVMLHLENWCTEKPRFENGIPLTNKKDKKNHGFGVKSIQYLVKKYEGELSMRAHDQKFYLDISFPMLCRL